MTIAQKSWRSTGLKSDDTGMSEESKASDTPTSSAEGSRASRSPTPAKGKARKIRAGSGLSSSASFAWYDLDTCSWRTFQASLAPTKDSRCLKFLGTWPKAGMIVSGTASAHAPLELRTGGKGSSSWLTPQEDDSSNVNPNEKRRMILVKQVNQRQTWPTATTADSFTDKLKSSQQKPGSMHSVNLSQAVQLWPTPRSGIGMSWRLTKGMAKLRHKKYLETEVAYQEGGTGGQLNPAWVEWLMGFPPGWTDLSASETPSSLRSRKPSVT